VNFFNTNWLRSLSQFQVARLKLTGLYLVIIMSISILFSIATFRLQSGQLETRFARYQFIIRQYQNIFPGQQVPVGVPNIEDSLTDLKLNLFYLNLIILALSTAAGYFLAGRTLQPIQKSLDDQARFIADASHEMRTPLTALRTSTEVAIRDKDLSREDAHALLTSNLKKINALQGLSESLLKLAHDGKLTERMVSPVSVSEIVADAISQVGSAAKEKKIGITSSISDLVVLGDAKSLTDLYIILLDNAVKYCPEGAQVDLSGELLDRSVVLRVDDNGLGIPEADLGRIFERFYRVDKSRSQQVGGYGLGLSIAKRIVELHGGTITVASNHTGSRFTIKLPHA
jgi:two-component system, OmpR family, sensor histidine kinase CiaH